MVVTCCAQQILRRDGDPEVFVLAARLLLRGQDIYLTPTPHGRYYYYPPFFACLNIPLTYLPVGAVIVLWALASVGLLGWSMAAFYSGMTGRTFFSLPSKTRWAVCLFSIILSARFIILHLRFGQSNIFVLALAVLGLTWLTRKQRVRGGAALALSIVLKLTTLPFGFWFAARRSGRVLLGMLLGGLFGVMLPALIVGVRQDVSYHREWVETVALSNEPGTGNWANSGNVSLRAQADRFFLPVDAFEYRGRMYRVTLFEPPGAFVRLVGQLLMLSVALVIGLYAVRFRRAPELISRWGGFAFVFSLIPNFSPVAEIPHLVLLLPAYLYVVHLWHVQRLRDRTFRTLVVLSFVCTTLTTNIFVGMFFSRLLTSVGFISLGMLLLSAAIFRAATCLRRNPAFSETTGETNAASINETNAASINA
ncbi:MAG TPA: glycosyltransferase family 87 protein [Pyrinomonadaceae bacterium]|nr:glycosyltransferase family 87 protein [Pyrinomonadaceae bacterium]